jgi:hypothetical protein
MSDLWNSAVQLLDKQQYSSKRYQNAIPQVILSGYVDRSASVGGAEPFPKVHGLD